MVAAINSTLVDIRAKVRRLTGSPSTLQLTDDALDEYINTAYAQDVPADIKSDMFRQRVSIYTKPNIDRYAISGTLAANTTADNYESIREPVYVNGSRVKFYKDRGQFYGSWPVLASLSTAFTGVVVGSVVEAIDVSGDPTIEITTDDTTGLADGDTVTFYALAGTVELNGNEYIVANVTATTFEVTQAAASVFVSGGTWAKLETLDLGVPVLQNELTISMLVDGLGVSYKDDGDPTGTGTGSISDVDSGLVIGTVEYSTGIVIVGFPNTPDDDTVISLWYYTYSPGMPLAVLWFRNELIVRPVPDRGYRVDVEAYVYPTQFNSDGDTPELKQWWQYISLLAARKIMEDRQDIDGIQNVTPIIAKQESLVRNRTANNQIGMRNTTIYEENESRLGFPYGFTW